MRGTSFRNGGAGSVHDNTHHRGIHRNSDNANTYSSRSNDAHAGRFGYPTNDGLWPQVSTSRYQPSTPDFTRLACLRRHSLPPISSPSAWEQAEDEDLTIEEVPLRDLLHHRHLDRWASDSDISHLENATKTLTKINLKRDLELHSLKIKNLSKTLAEIPPRRALIPEIGEFEGISKNPANIPPGRLSGPEFHELRTGQRFQYSSPTQIDEMPDPRILPEMHETPESVRHARYQARPGKCHHTSVLRYWVNEDAPERVCDTCGGTARFLWSCTADTPDWTDASPRSAGPASAVPAASEHVPALSSSFDVAANKPASPAPPTNDPTLTGFSSTRSAYSGLAAPPGLAGNESASTGPAATSSTTTTLGLDITILAEWMQKAITKGAYTPAQVQKLVKQKLQVVECAARDRAVQAERATKTAYAARPPTTEEERTVREWLARQPGRESQPDGNIQENPWNAGPCRAFFCPRCHWELTERSIGHIDQVANESYVVPPNIPEYLNRPISDAAVLREMRPMHWMRGRDFGLWWQENRYSSGRDMVPVLRHALSGEWTEEQFKFTSWWVYWQRRSEREIGACVKWLEARNLEQISSFSQSIADSRFIVPRSSERQCSHMSMGLDPVLSISRHPIWEEFETQEGLVVYPGWEYSLEHRWQALSRLEHQELTRLVTEQRDALITQGASSAPSQIAYSPPKLTQKTTVIRRTEKKSGQPV
ncbi:uncharacterized protein N7477_004486 [Penicillium maclennaniae]|uniref:uncharacterized protein n=1 Tax=Penicillium maclennaniae TaxID=1343394 RepID=UPI00253F77BA|nr:uncharacterized protein N7477_004486 [Penicillium maclennaniae]KAJ5674552.1 hypothetical protein N7477_004486 [Penicillium maclennaniae]